MRHDRKWLGGTRPGRLDAMSTTYDDVAFTDAVRRVQERYGSRSFYDRWAGELLATQASTSGCCGADSSKPMSSSLSASPAPSEA